MSDMLFVANGVNGTNGFYRASGVSANAIMLDSRLMHLRDLRA